MILTGSRVRRKSRYETKRVVPAPSPCMAQMRLQDIAEPQTITRLERFHHLFMFLHRRAPQFRVDIGGKADAEQPGIDVDMFAVQHLIMACCHDRIVNLAVEPVISEPVLHIEGRAHFISECGDMPDLTIVSALAGKLARCRFEDLHHFNGGQHDFIGKPGDDGSAIGRMLNKALSRQEPQGLAQRRAADAEFRTKLAFGNLGPWSQIAQQDALADAIGNPFAVELHGTGLAVIAE